MNSTTIYIVSSGAIGKALAVILAHSGKKVVLLRASTDLQPASKATYRLHIQKEIITEEITVQSLNDANLEEGIILVTSKSYGNHKVAALIASKNKHLPIVILQNGIGVEKAFKAYDFTALYRCVLFATSQVEGDDIYFRHVMPSPVGIVNGDTALMEKVVQSFSTPAFPFCTTTDIAPVIWKKSIANCVFNSICPLLGVDNGIFIRNAEALEIARQIINECLPVAQAAGISLDEAAVLESVKLISTNSDGQFISTLQDIIHGRETEIDTLNLEVARTALAYGLKEPAITKTLGTLIRLKSDSKTFNK